MYFRRIQLKLARWVSYARNKSYNHIEQVEGRVFRPDALAGYFNDMTLKADWPGLFVASVPVVDTDTCRNYQFPIVIFQWALGNWDAWLLSGRTSNRHLSAFLAAADWAVDAQDAAGGWSCWVGYAIPTTSPYSAMAQGEGLSVLVRAADIRPDTKKYREAADRAVQLLQDTSEHELMCQRSKYASFEEYPGSPLPGVLNGWIFCLVGLHDYALAINDPAFSRRLAEHVTDLATALDDYDTGYWSYYDLAGHLTSPFYHDLHIAQLRAIARIWPHEASRLIHKADTFSQYRENRLFSTWAFIVKVKQKLLQPNYGVLHIAKQSEVSQAEPRDCK